MKLSSTSPSDTAAGFSARAAHSCTSESVKPHAQDYRTRYLAYRRIGARIRRTSTLSPFQSILFPKTFQMSSHHLSRLREACESTRYHYRSLTNKTYINVVIFPPKRGFGPPTMIETFQPACLVIDSAASCRVRGSLLIAFSVEVRWVDAQQQMVRTLGMSCYRWTLIPVYQPSSACDVPPPLA